VTTQAHTQVDYSKYWMAWLCLLFITLAMVFIGTPAVLITGMTLKATIIALWFMHLRYERVDFALCIVFGIFATALILFLLIFPDGRAM